MNLESKLLEILAALPSVSLVSAPKFAPAPKALVVAGKVFK